MEEPQYLRCVQVGEIVVSSNDPKEDLRYLIGLAKTIMQDKTMKNYLKIVQLKKNGEMPTYT